MPYNDLELNQFILSKLQMVLPANSKIGNTIIFRCPICGDSKKYKTKRRGVLYTSPNVNYYCFNCDIWLSGFKLLEALSGAEFPNIMSEYARLKLDLFGQHSPTLATDMIDDRDLLPKGAVPELSDLTEAERLYLDKRLITKLPHFDSMHLSNAVDSKHKNVDFMFIPWLQHGNLINFQLHNFSKHKGIDKYKFQRNADKAVYGLDRIDRQFKYIICFEGVFDSVFVKNGVAIGGKKLTDIQENEIRRRYPNHEIVLSFDADNAGLATTADYIRTQPTAYKYFIWYHNTDIKDVNDMVIKANNPLFFLTNTIERLIFSSIEARFELTTYNLWLEQTPKKKKWIKHETR